MHISLCMRRNGYLRAFGNNLTCESVDRYDDLDLL